jgi:hypothetical protein
MREFSFAIVVAIALALFPGFGAQVEAQVAPPTTLSWDEPQTNNCVGQPPACSTCIPPVLACPVDLVDLAGYRVEFTLNSTPSGPWAAARPFVPAAAANPPAGSSASVLLTSLTAVVADAKYLLRVIAVDLVLNESQPSVGALWDRNTVAPSTPTNTAVR